MLKGIKALDYKASYAYAPPVVDAVINTDDVQTAIPCDARCSEPTMRIRFRDGSTVVAIGKPADLLRPPQES